MTLQELTHIASQLQTILAEMQRPRSKTLGSITGKRYDNCFFPPHVLPSHAFSSYSEFIDMYRYILLHFCTEKFTEDLLSKLPRHAPIRFAHADLLPRNIMVDGTTITAVIDWATAGFWPGYWEYCRMHNPEWASPGWDRVLGLVFPEERRSEEIKAACYLNRIVMDYFWV
ncbi:hypothetical protein BDP27DRAFT_1212893 [Rhodocollybia butyracea]|uniref:Aminoglycoside phosphotransferase domain-containing protein n=1 Tax=Rhodocollybia butyracea TaxID=206335 RepID=A0A9P5Q5G7_9AGAR|nr:hypothetical protein BDP27DRAFT_1212893 [Rhodocollybia butyracea]